MATATLQVRTKIAWWVRPYLACAVAFARTTELLLDLDEDCLDGWAAKEARFIARHGVKAQIRAGNGRWRTIKRSPDDDDDRPKGPRRFTCDIDLDLF